MAKKNKINVNQDFEIKTSDIELLADYFIAKDRVKFKYPTYGAIVRAVFKELGTKYPIDRLPPDLKKRLMDFVAKFISKKYIWR